MPVAEDQIRQFATAVGEYLTEQLRPVLTDAMNGYVNLDELIDEEAAATFTGVAVRTLQKWRNVRTGPPFYRLSSHTVRYRRRDLLAWAAQHFVATMPPDGREGVPAPVLPEGGDQ